VLPNVENVVGTRIRKKLRLLRMDIAPRDIVASVMAKDHVIF
jgi:hypothetical protein